MADVSFNATYKSFGMSTAPLDSRDCCTIGASSDSWWLGHYGAFPDKHQDPLDSFEAYPYKGVKYLKANRSGVHYFPYGKYLSVNRNGYLGFYDWSGASGWRIEGEYLVSAWNGQRVGFDSNGYAKADNSLKSLFFSRGYNGPLYSYLVG